MMYYFDYSATTKTDKEVLDRFNEVSQKYFGNANSSYEFARKCKKVIDDTSCIIADYFGIMPNEIIYTSGASEANNNYEDRTFFSCFYFILFTK